jgi:hypothetical protein
VLIFRRHPMRRKWISFKLLLERGADPYVIGKGMDREWPPLKIARYHGADQRIIQLLKDKIKAMVTAKEGAYP